MATFVHYRGRRKPWRAQVRHHGRVLPKMFATKPEVEAWAIEQENKILSGDSDTKTLIDLRAETVEKLVHRYSVHQSRRANCSLGASGAIPFFGIRHPDLWVKIGNPISRITGNPVRGISSINERL